MYEHSSSHGRREREVYKYLRNVKSRHTGFVLVRRAIDDFQISSADNTYSYQCLVHPPLAMSLCELRNRVTEKVLPEDLLKPTLIHILLAVDFLHTEAKIVHTEFFNQILDMQENNAMLTMEDDSILVDFEEAERSTPSPRKMIGDRVIYSSRDLGIPKVHGRPILSDFDSSTVEMINHPWH
ncbi:protein kinase [Penicillium macrosclerotiorum]|uniref:protein kinase n=1 Tax=Penicillium macrosclerotiorum TaxID=303699 RepID=UPI002547C650|nr:protein kinase [Penicillium macrosclerotiorum]KAJ5682377.1 protein kinase [Penicillium macrosclerotiorum]